MKSPSISNAFKTDSSYFYFFEGVRGCVSDLHLKCYAFSRYKKLHMNTTTFCIKHLLINFVVGTSLTHVVLVILCDRLIHLDLLKTIDTTRTTSNNCACSLDITGKEFALYQIPVGLVDKIQAK